MPGSLEFRIFYGLSSWVILAKWQVTILIVIIPYTSAAVYSEYFCLYVLI